MANSSSCSSSANEILLPDSSSTCLTHGVTAKHDFVVTNFSLLCGMGKGNHVSSNTFTVGDSVWKIWLYPDGDEPDTNVSVYLLFRRGPECRRAKYSMSLFGKDDQGPRKKRKQEQKCTGIKASTEGTINFEPPESNSSYSRWADCIDKSKLRELLLASNDCITIRCVLTVLAFRTQDASTIVVPPSDLHQDFARMLKDADGADVTINVGDWFFPAHRYVLAARSRVFKAQLFGVMKDANTECLKIEDMEPSVFERLLHCIYTDSLPEDYEGDKRVAMMHLLVAADRYELKRLRLMCEEKLCGWIDVESVAAILGLADQHHRVQLKEACLGFIALPDTLGAVMETEGFKDLIAGYPMIMKEILDKIASSSKFDLDSDD